jgi:hypothetical protein
MVKYWIYYDDGNFELIKCPECSLDDVSHTHGPSNYEEMVCNQCATRFNLEKRKEKIVKIVSEEEGEPPEILSDSSLKSEKEYAERARRLRSENRE